MALSVRQFLLGVFGAVAAHAAGKRRRLPPGDESASDPSFAKFLAELKRVAASRDGAALRTLCAPDVITGIDAPDGPAALVQKMNTGGWAKLERVLAMGAGKYEKGFALPYVFAKFPDDLEGFEHVVTVRAGAVLRREGRADAAVVCPLDYDILHIDDARPVRGWLRASRLDGPSGWISESDVRSQGAERIFIEKKNGAWKITAWAAGD